MPYFVNGWSFTVWLTSCLTRLDLAEQVNLLLIKHKESSWIQTGQTGGQTYSDTSLAPLVSFLWLYTPHCKLPHFTLKSMNVVFNGPLFLYFRLFQKNLRINELWICDFGHKLVMFHKYNNSAILRKDFVEWVSG